MTTNEPQGDGLEVLKWIIDNSCFYGDVTARAKRELARAEEALSAIGPGPCGKHPLACYEAGTTELEFRDGVLIAEVAGELPYCRICAVEAERDKLREALSILYEETADHIRVNNLGDVHHNRSMQLARAALDAAKG